jgi:hypothetical protein
MKPEDFTMVRISIFSINTMLSNRLKTSYLCMDVLLRVSRVGRMLFQFIRSLHELNKLKF